MEHLYAIQNALARLAREEDGSQVIEYALIIAVVSIALVVALQALTTGTTFSGFVSRVQTCLTAGQTCV